MKVKNLKMPVYNCTKRGCEWSTGECDGNVIGPLVTHHLAEKHPVEVTKLPKLPLPKIGERVSSDRWEMFLSEWQSFKTSNGLINHDVKSVNSYLLHACEPNLKASVWKQDPKIEEKTTDLVLALIKDLAVHRVAKNVAASELFSARQEQGESGIAFAARLRGKARLCGFKKKCTCAAPTDVNFEDEIVQKVFLSGLSDEDVRREVLCTDACEGKSLDETVKLVEAREVALRSVIHGQEAGGYHQKKKKDKIDKDDPRVRERKKCKGCRNLFNCNVIFAGKLKTFETCRDCYLKEKEAKKSTEDAGAFQQ